MLASTRTSLARSGASPALRVASRRTALPRARLGARFQSSSTQQAQSFVNMSEGAGTSSSHLAAGVAGGVTVLLAGLLFITFWMRASKR